MGDVTGFWNFLHFGKALHGFLRRWNKDTFGNLNDFIANDRNEILQVQQDMEYQCSLETLFKKELVVNSSLASHLDS